MPLKLLVCDVLTAKDDRVYLTELCPALSCARTDVVEGCYCGIFLAIFPQSVKLLQAPQDPHDAWLSHYQRDVNREPFIGRMAGIPKQGVRQHLTDIIQGNPRAHAALWVKYFKTKDGICDVAEKFALVLQRLLRQLKTDIEVLDAYPLVFACDRNKVLFWQLLKLANSDVLIPKDLFRFSTFDARQKARLAAFLQELPGEEVMIKPTNSTLTLGVLVVSKIHIIQIIDWVVDSIRQGGVFSLPVETHDSQWEWLGARGIVSAKQSELIDKLRTLLCPDYSQLDALTQIIIRSNLCKFVNFWLQIDVIYQLRCDRDFFLVEPYKAPKAEPMGDKVIGVARRGYFAISNVNESCQLSQVSVSIGKRYYLPDQFLPMARRYINKISFCANLYTADILKSYSGNIADYFHFPLPIADEYSLRVIAALNQPKEQTWIQQLVTDSFSDLIVKIRAMNPEHRELREYLDSAAIQDLNLENVEFCWHCFRMARDLKRCTACHRATYCSPACQKADWGGFHRIECKQLRTLPVSDGNKKSGAAATPS